MCKRNATASWSGYSHQGQVGLFIALRQLRENGINLNTHYVQFETHEDVAIYEGLDGGAKTYLSVHQVKAYYSATNTYKSTYNDVLNGPFEAGNVRYIHSAVEIADWETSATTNNNEVLRYPYSRTKNYCGTTEIESFIKAELTAILGVVAPAVIDNAYYRLLFELDHRIRQEHQKVHKDRFDIKFSLNEINELIRSNDAFTNKDIYDCRKLFYDTYIDIIKNDDVPKARIDAIENNIIKEINALDDVNFLSFLQRMNLNEPPGNLKYAPIFYNSPGLKQVFFRMLIEIIGIDPSLSENVVSYHKKTEPSQFVLTAIIDEERDKFTVVQNILTNLNSQDLLWENHSLVNKHIEVELIKSNPSINEVTTSEEREDDSNKFMSFTNSKLVLRETAIEKLNNGADH